ncbi:pyridoxal 5'-phosphate synthase PDX1-like 4 [Pyrus communis]|uniref:pyridoxal 5'-phosphate synthase PDX1-like 4 n=1 Tax=Pyrus communis TaxID=23211 RepID=UPI0035C241CE
MVGLGVVAMYGNNAIAKSKKSSFSVKVDLAQMFHSDVIIDIVNDQQTQVMEEAGACTIMALKLVPTNIRAQGGIARMSNPQLIKEIKQAVTILAMAKASDQGVDLFVGGELSSAIDLDLEGLDLDLEGLDL